MIIVDFVVPFVEVVVDFVGSVNRNEGHGSAATNLAFRSADLRSDPVAGSNRNGEYFDLLGWRLLAFILVGGFRVSCGLRIRCLRLVCG